MYWTEHSLGFYSVAFPVDFRQITLVRLWWVLVCATTFSEVAAISIWSLALGFDTACPFTESGTVENSSVSFGVEPVTEWLLIFLMVDAVAIASVFGTWRACHLYLFRRKIWKGLWLSVLLDWNVGHFVRGVEVDWDVCCTILVPIVFHNKLVFSSRKFVF